MHARSCNLVLSCTAARALRSQRGHLPPPQQQIATPETQARLRPLARSSTPLASLQTPLASVFVSGVAPLPAPPRPPLPPFDPLPPFAPACGGPSHAAPPTTRARVPARACGNSLLGLPPPTRPGAYRLPRACGPRRTTPACPVTCLACHSGLPATCERGGWCRSTPRPTRLTARASTARQADSGALARAAELHQPRSTSPRQCGRYMGATLAHLCCWGLGAAAHDRPVAPLADSSCPLRSRAPQASARRSICCCHCCDATLQSRATRVGGKPLENQPLWAIRQQQKARAPGIYQGVAKPRAVACSASFTSGRPPEPHPSVQLPWRATSEAGGAGCRRRRGRMPSTRLARPAHRASFTPNHPPPHPSPTPNRAASTHGVSGARQRARMHRGRGGGHARNLWPNPRCRLRALSAWQPASRSGR